MNMRVVEPLPKVEHLRLRQLIDVRDLDLQSVGRIFDRAERLEHVRDSSLAGKSLCWIAGPKAASTRTSMSFKAAMQQLGGTCLDLPDPENSSESKGESPIDTVRVVGTYNDVIVIRHGSAEFPREAALASSVPVINAGNGPDQHPSQFLLDAFTIKQKLGRLTGLKIGIVGDLAKGRAARSLALGIATLYPKNELFGVPGPRELGMGEDVREYLAYRGVLYSEYAHLADIITKVDVLYMTRLQAEWERAGLLRLRHEYPKLTPQLATCLDKRAIIMHPLPANRSMELPVEIDQFPQSVYFKEQLRAGLTVRKALLQELLLTK